MKDVTIFTTKTWPHCKTAKEFLSKNSIHFIEKDINLDKDARNELIKRKITGVPTLLIGEDVVVGLDEAKVLQLVDHRLTECPNCHAKLRIPTNKEQINISCPKCKYKIK